MKAGFTTFLDDCLALAERAGKPSYAIEEVQRALDDAGRVEQITIRFVNPDGSIRMGHEALNDCC